MQGCNNAKQFIINKKAKRLFIVTWHLILLFSLLDIGLKYQSEVISCEKQNEPRLLKVRLILVW